eukprot:NODE_1073_length_1250_cov_417.409205.p2 GENE.NODE_1073_length_1250_cov_417.409205~~NODE_1073_length_1250_cov_417.409205.p2  ORF type:complete len:108 (+),score=33.57 NODE_1073_length_1250_cov_417.409205:473-796(+)
MNAMLVNVSLTKPYLFNPGNPKEVWYNMVLGVTKFYHSGCEMILLEVHGLESRPCVHVMLNRLGVGKCYIYPADEATKGSDDAYCCDDTFGESVALGTMNPRFMDTM